MRWIKVMRSVPAGSFGRITSERALFAAYARYRRGKRRRPSVATFDLEADRHLFALHRSFLQDRYRPGRFRLRVIRDPKTRLIAAPPIRDRIVHQALVGDIGTTFERSFLPESYAWGTGKGPHRAVFAHLRLQRRYRYRCALDIAGYFPSIDTGILASLFEHRLRDHRTLGLLHMLLDAGSAVYQDPLAKESLGLGKQSEKGRGLPIGSLLSQWSGALYLDGLDHFVKRALKIPAYIRYMDDFVLFGDRSDGLHRARTAIASWLAAKRALRLNPKRGSIVCNRNAAVFLGYRIARTGISPSKKLKRRMKARLRVLRHGDPSTLARSLQSYRGVMTFG